MLFKVMFSMLIGFTFSGNSNPEDVCLIKMEGFQKEACEVYREDLSSKIAEDNFRVYELEEKLSQKEPNSLVLKFKHLLEEDNPSRQTILNFLMKFSNTTEEELKILKEIEKVEKRMKTNQTKFAQVTIALEDTVDWLFPVKDKFKITASTWNYRSKELGFAEHYGYDLGIPIGTKLYASGDGVITHVQTGCPFTGSLDSVCGNNAGNSVEMLQQMAGNLYYVRYLHMGNVNVTKGEQVKQGELLGTSASSGKSSGPHLHYEIIYLGPKSIKDYNLNRDKLLELTKKDACEVNSYQAPCRMNPESLFGYKYGYEGRP